MGNLPWTSQCQQYKIIAILTLSMCMIGHSSSWQLKASTLMTERKGHRYMWGRERREKDTVSSSSLSVTAALENSNKPPIVEEHELFLLRGWQALDLCCPCCHILTLERGSEVKPLNTVKWAITALFNLPRGPWQSWNRSCVDYVVICLVHANCFLQWKNYI